MTRSCFVLSAALLCGCLDFDVFRTEPTTGATSSASTGGNGGGGDGGAGGGSTSSTTTGMGGMGGSGGEAPDLPPCGGLQDDFEGAAPLTWDVFMGSFTNGLAVGQPPQSIFRLNATQATVLDECAILVEFVNPVASGQMYFEWSWTRNFYYVFRILTNDGNLTRIDLTTDAGTNTNPPILDSTPFLTGWARISNVGTDFRIETADTPNGPWLLRVVIPEASAPAWLSDPGVAEFGTYGATGAPASFDNFNTP